MRHAILVALFAVIVSSLFSPSLTAQEPGSQRTAYKAELEGVMDDALKSDIQAASRLFSLADHPPPGIIALRRRADADRERVDEVLHSRGYYDGSLDISIDDQVSPVKVVMRVTPGPVTLLSGWTVVPDVGIGPKDVGLTLGSPAVAADVVKAQTTLLERLAERGQPLAKVEERRAVVDHASHRMTVTETIVPGPVAHFAAPTISGLVDVDPVWVRNRVPWRTGDRFDPAKIEKLRKSLNESSLFNTIRITTGKALDSRGLLPVDVTLAERPTHSVGAGVVYSTAEGPGAQVFWEDRNLFGEAERLRLTALGSRLRELALADYRAPDFFAPDQDLVSDISYQVLRSEVFYSRTAAVSSGIEWRLSPIWTVSAAGSIERDNAVESGLSDISMDLFSIPLSAKRDTTDDILDPTRGGRTTLQVRPYFEINADHRQFTRVEVQQTEHFKLLSEPRVILALWGNAGSYLNSKAVDLPADKRFYAGGAGSVRGYKLYYAGPLDIRGQPAGGRSLLAFGSELRIKVTETVGLVPFVEGGNVYPTPLPQLDQRLFYAAGLGVRYYTPIGPVRLDVAVPLERRSGVDSAYQIYVGLGQAF